MNVGKMFCHAGLANPVAEIQCAVLHHELVEGLPLTALIFHAFAITAGADESLVVMHPAELLHQERLEASPMIRTRARRNDIEVAELIAELLAGAIFLIATPEI